MAAANCATPVGDSAPVATGRATEASNSEAKAASVSRIKTAVCTPLDLGTQPPAFEDPAYSSALVSSGS